jgi:uncharacterized protein YjbI with pentapeptide repeats
VTRHAGGTAPAHPEGWQAYWHERGQGWRTEPEISESRQARLANCLASVDGKAGNFPFAKVQLSRADVEWLLANHDGGRGPIDWANIEDRGRLGLDLRGANLRHADLAGLPLARLRGGLMPQEYVPIYGNHLHSAAKASVDLRNANLYRAHLEGAILTWAHLEEASLERAHLEGANLEDAYLMGASLRRAELWGASLRFASFDARSNLNYAELRHPGSKCSRVGDTSWGDINLSLIDWSSVRILGDEERARQSAGDDGAKKAEDVRLTEYRTAVRANRQLSVALQAQGATEEAAYFAYRAQRLQRTVLRRQRKYLRCLLNLMLDCLAGFGYRPIRTLAAYSLAIAAFAMLYVFLQVPTSMGFGEALVVSIVNFHGRGFFPNGVVLTDIAQKIAAVEAVLGLIVEASLVATFTQRFLGR